jgi:ABC-type glycerol-3-phosphate transport system substrate-binding protein
MKQVRLSRRDFLRTAAVASAAGLVVACQPPAPPPAAPAAATPAPQAEQPTAAPQATVQEAPAAAVVIKWWDFPRGWAPPGSTEAPNAWNEEMAKKYAELNPGVTVEFTGVSWSDGPQKLDVALAANEGPNIMYGYPALFGKMLSLDTLAPIDDFVATMDAADVNDFFPPAWDFVTVDGKKWAWPWYYGSEGEWAINTTVAEEAGAQDMLPKAPAYGWTPEEMLAFAQKTTFKRANGEEVWGLALWTNEQQGINIWPLWSFPYMFGGKLYDEQTRKSEFGNEAGVKAFQFMYDLVEKDKVAPPGAGGLTGADVGELWNRKQLTTRISGGVEALIGLKAALDAGTIQGPFEVLPVQPPTSAGLPVRTNGGIGVQMVFKKDDPAALKEAMKFAQWLTSAQNMEILGYLTPLTARQSTTQKLAGDDPVTKWRIEYILPTMASYSKAPEDFKIDDAWMQALQSMYAKERTPQEAATWFEGEANKLLQGS